jgi:hypothetical protein
MAIHMRTELVSDELKELSGPAGGNAANVEVALRVTPA